MHATRPVRFFLALFSALVILAGLAWQPGAAALVGPPLPHADDAPTPTGGATSIVPLPPQVVERMRQEGRPLPDLSQYKMSPSPVRPRPLQGNVNLLAVMVDFTGTPGTVTNLTVFDNLVYAAPVSGRGSVRDYYDEVTRGTLTIATVNLPSTTGWRAAGNTMSYFANGQYGMNQYSYPQNAAGMVAAVLSALDPLVNFANYDNDGDGQVDTLLVIHAGTGAEWSLNANHIWSHASSISGMGGIPYYSTDGVSVDNYVTVPEYWEPSLVGPNTTDLTVGVVCHEIAHGLFGLPDLYDLIASPYPAVSFGIGQWGLMSYGDWNGPSKWNSFVGYAVTDGSSPAWPEAWTRVLLRWDTATLVMNPASGVCLPPVETTANAILRFKTAGLRVQEYFLVENRRTIANSYDEWLPSSGLLIWHVDEAFWSLYGGPDNNTECRSLPNPHCTGACATTHYLVSLEQADRQDHLEFGTNRGDAGDPFPGSSGNTAWQWYGHNPVNPESGNWYDGCGRDSCIDLVNIATAAPNVCFDIAHAQCAAAEADLGDAPASDNNHGNAPMTAYHFPYVQARFPTVFFAGTPPASGQGPRHHLALVDSWLGIAMTVESNADQMPDQDGMPNISPTVDMADMDSVIYGGDDGLHVPLAVAHCNTTTVPFTMTVVSQPIFGLIPRYLNVWADWSRDGDWADIESCLGGPSADEWVYHNMMLLLPQGTYSLYLMPITSKAKVSEGNIYEIWLRLSVADKPAPGPADGRGPVQGYDLGETEDYYLVLSPTLQISLPPTQPFPGQPLTYTIQYGGMGDVLAKGVVISDVLPQGIEFLTANPMPDLYNPATRTAYWTTNLDPTAPGTIQMTVLVTGLPGATITNTAYLLWGDQIWLRSAVSFQIASCGPGDPTAGFTWSQPACVGQPIQFTNQSSGSPPLSFAWDLDGDGDTDSAAVDPTWTYGAPGPYTVTLTVSNTCGTDTFSATVAVLQPIASLAIAGPLSLLPDQVGTYTAVPTPPDATNPLYLWDSGATGGTTTYSWSSAGLYTIAVTGSNACGSATATLDVLVTNECISLTGVTISGPASLQVGEEGTYLAVIAPPTATNPAYLWNDGSTGWSAVYSWTTAGTYTVAVTASNCLNVAVDDSLVVTVGAAQHRIYLPLIVRAGP